jgi:hypothetical protein
MLARKGVRVPVHSSTAGRCRGPLAATLVTILAGLSFGEDARGDLVWQSFGFSNGQAIVDGTTLTASTGTGVTIGRSEFSDNDSGGNDITPGGNADYVTYQPRRLGGQSRYLELSLDNISNDPADYVELTLAFDQAVTDLQFSLLDVDGNNGWDDGVEVYYNGLNVRDDPSILAINGSYNMPDDKPYMHGWEGIGRNAGNGRDVANIDFDFGALAISSLTIRFFSTTDAATNPAEQEIGLSDLTFSSSSAVPEPSAMACLGVFAVLLAVAQIRRRSGRRVTVCGAH